MSRVIYESQCCGTSLGVAHFKVFCLGCYALLGVLYNTADWHLVNGNPKSPREANVFLRPRTYVRLMYNIRVDSVVCTLGLKAPTTVVVRYLEGRRIGNTVVKDNPRSATVIIPLEEYPCVVAEFYIARGEL